MLASLTDYGMKSTWLMFNDEMLIYHSKANLDGKSIHPRGGTSLLGHMGVCAPRISVMSQS